MLKIDTTAIMSDAVNIAVNLFRLGINNFVVSAVIFTYMTALEVNAVLTIQRGK